ncbi:MAG: glutamine-hydrolyzing GMP synthase, partial [Burkholderiales bacterium]
MDKILILDFGSQVSQLIARRVREAHVYCELHPFDMSLEDIKAFAPKGIILSGGPNSVYESDYQADSAVFELGIPVMGICYGMQWMAQTLGGKVEPGTVREFGYAEIRARGHSKLLEGLQDGSNDAGHGLLDVWMSHGDKVTALPAGFNLIAETPSCPIAAMANEDKGFYGVQFHPEVTHTRKGTEILHRFVLHICN